MHDHTSGLQKNLREAFGEAIISHMNSRASLPGSENLEFLEPPGYHLPPIKQIYNPATSPTLCIVHPKTQFLKNHLNKTTPSQNEPTNNLPKTQSSTINHHS